MPKVSVRGVLHYYAWVCQVNDSDVGLSELDESRHLPQSPETGPTGKPVLVFLHGWGGSARYWESTAQSLANEFDCLLYDLRGFGRSPVSETSGALDYEMVTYGDDLLALLDTFGLERVFLNAHSMGASVATVFVNRHPERVHRLVLTCSGIFEYDERAFKTFHQFGRYVVLLRPRWLKHVPGLDRLFMARFLHRPLPQAIQQAFLEDFLMADFDAALGTIFTSVSLDAAQTMPGEFSRLSVPTLLVAGEHDQIIPAQMGQQAAQLSENIEFFLIPKTGHFPMLEDSRTYLQRVKNFLLV